MATAVDGWHGVVGGGSQRGRSSSTENRSFNERPSAPRERDPTTAGRAQQEPSRGPRVSEGAHRSSRAVGSGVERGPAGLVADLGDSHQSTAIEAVPTMGGSILPKSGAGRIATAYTPMSPTITVTE